MDTTPDIPENDANISVGFSVKPSDDSEWLSNTTITVPEGATVYHVFTKALAAADMTSVGAASVSNSSRSSNHAPMLHP